MDGQVTVDGRQLNAADRHGEWKVLNLEGWFDSPDRKQRSESRPLADGDYPTQEFFDVRNITIDGRLKAKSHDMVHEAENWLKGMILNGSAMMMVRGHGPNQSASVRLAGGIKCKVEPGTDDYLRWQIRLKAIDPYKYGEARTFSGRQTITADLYQRGNAPAWPVVTVSGSSSSQPYTLTLNGKSVTIPGGRSAADPDHVIDYRTGIFRVGTTVIVGALGAANFAPVNPGLPQTMTMNSPIDTRFSVKLSDAYI